MSGRVLHDPYSDEENPRRILFSDVQEAATLINGSIDKTPLDYSRHLSRELGIEIYLKKEFLHPTSSFKERGARYTLLKLSDEAKQRGVVAASIGNHALGVAYHGSKLGIPVTVVCPKNAPLVKIKKCRELGANVIVHGETFTGARIHALELSVSENKVYINGFDHPHVIAGQGTVGIEICQQMGRDKKFDAVLVCVGGGGLLAGVSLAIKALRPEVEVIGVESENGPGFQRAIEEDRPVEVVYRFGLTGGSGPVRVGTNAFATAKPNVDRMITVSEDYIALAILKMIELEKSIIEGLGALSLAALLENKLPHLKGKTVVCLCSGGNIDTSVLSRAIDRGLTVEGRLLHITVRLENESDLFGTLAGFGVKVRNIQQNRGVFENDSFADEINIVLETSGKLQAVSIIEELSKKFKVRAQCSSY